MSLDRPAQDRPGVALLRSRWVAGEALCTAIGDHLTGALVIALSDSAVEVAACIAMRLGAELTRLDADEFAAWPYRACAEPGASGDMPVLWPALVEGVAGRRVVLVDDGLLGTSPLITAARSTRLSGALHVRVAVPVLASDFDLRVGYGVVDARHQLVEVLSIGGGTEVYARGQPYDSVAAARQLQRVARGREIPPLRSLRVRHAWVSTPPEGR